MCTTTIQRSTPHRASTPLRVSTRDRDAVLDELRLHHTAGRLDLAEYEDRVERALAATTTQDLAGLLEDLPRLPSVRPITLAVDLVALATVVTAVVTIAVWLAVGGPFWPIFPIMGTASALVPLLFVRRAIVNQRTG